MTTEELKDLRPGDVVQIDPNSGGNFGGCMLMVESIENWGVLGFVASPNAPRETPSVRYYYRCPVEHMMFVGKAPWVPTDSAYKGVDGEAEPDRAEPAP
jgi:hypothetical protein